MTTGIAKLEEAEHLLAQVSSIDDARKLADKAAAALVWARRAHKGLAVCNAASEIKLRAERMAGQMLGKLERGHGPGRGKRGVGSAPLSEYGAAIAEGEISKNQARLWQELAAIPEDEFSKRLEVLKVKAEKLTNSAILSVTSSSTHDGDEWGTPAEIVERERAVMGSIDLDPASNSEAQKIVRAGIFYTKADDGLSKPWRGNVHLNCPYSQPLCQQFIAKLIGHVSAGDVAKAVLIVNANTDPEWFHLLCGTGATVCFTRGRLAFLGPGWVPVAGNRMGQAIWFFNCDRAAVRQQFGEIGSLMELMR